MMKLFTKRNKGYSLIEILFYISILGVLSLVVINSLIVMAKSFKETAMNRDFMQAANMVERISRDIRRANGALGTEVEADYLKLIITENSPQVYNPTEFRLVGSDIQVFEDDVFVGNLNSPNLSVSDLSFYVIGTTEGAAIKFFFTVRPTSKYDFVGAETFYDTVVLRGGY